MSRFPRTLRWTLLGLLAFVTACTGESCGCTPPSTVGNGLQVTDANVRACDALFTVPGQEVPSVTFDAAVTGESIPKAPRFAVSFAASSDASLVGVEIARFTFTGQSDPPTLVESHCYDAAGAAVDGTPLTLSE